MLIKFYLYKREREREREREHLNDVHVLSSLGFIYMCATAVAI